MIIGQVDSLKRKKDFTQEEQIKLNIIENQCIKIKDLVNDLNLYPKIEHNTKFLREERFKIIPLLREIIVEYMNNLEDENYTISYELDDRLNNVSLIGDRMMLKRALENLINNSIIYNPHGCSIQVNATLQDTKLIIIIKDDGVGMKEKTYDIFTKENYYIDTDKTSFSLKYGLGLIISRKIIDNHGGTLRIEAKENYGFKNMITIPL